MLVAEKTFTPAGVSDDLEQIQYPAWAEVKHDGVRLTAECDGVGAVTLRAKSGRLYDLPTINAAVEKLDLRDQCLDGEFVAGTFAETLSVIRGGLPDTCGRFVNFDCVMHDDARILTSRRSHLERLAMQFPDDGALALVKGRVVRNKAEMRAFFRTVTRSGGEGIVVKNPGARYGERGAWVRLKNQQTFDGVVVETIEGKGARAGSLGAFVVEIDGVKSRVANGFSAAQRETFWHDRAELLGRWVAVGAKELTAAGRLREQQTVRLRESKA